MPVSAKARGMLTILAIVMCLAGAGHVYEAQGQTTLTPTAVSFNCTNLAEAAQGDPLRTTFLGVSTLLFDDGETQFLTDGFFSRPLNVFGQIEPDLARITSTLQRAGIARLAAVIPFHSHYDHAMDAPEVAKRTGAFLIGSASTANIGRGWGLSEERIRVFRAGERLTFGRFDIDVGLSRHSPGSEGGIIAEPLKPPVPASAYKEGGTYALLVTHHGRKLLLGVPGEGHNVQAEVVFLNLAVLGHTGHEEDYWRDIWQRAVVATKARRVIPVHWDFFFFPLEAGLSPIPAAANVLQILSRLGAASGVDVQCAPLWAKVNPRAGLNP